MATSVWTWGGKFFSSLENGNLRTNDGRRVGKLVDDQVYDFRATFVMADAVLSM